MIKYLNSVNSKLQSVETYRILWLLVCGCMFSISCGSSPRAGNLQVAGDEQYLDSMDVEDAAEPTIQEKAPVLVTAEDIVITKDLMYDKYTLEDEYLYNKTERRFQWDKIKDRLAFLENSINEGGSWVVFSNYKNRNGESPLIKNFRRNAYNRVCDTLLGTERYQSVPLYEMSDTLQPFAYGQDGALARIIDTTSGNFLGVEPLHLGGEWYVPKKYVKYISDSIVFNKVIFVDRTNQNIATLEKQADKQWVVRSMNPATTGRFKPPYAQRTPLGIFVVQDKKNRMVFLRDGSVETGGFAPYASRFTNGAYVHGVPTNEPNTSIIEYSYSLGTTPRSHMCVRNATSHAKFVYDWAPVNSSLVFVIEEDSL